MPVATTAAAPTPNDALLTRRQAAALLGIQTGTLAKWHSTGRHRIPVVRMTARSIRYRREDLLAFAARHLIGSGSPAADSPSGDAGDQK